MNRDVLLDAIGMVDDRFLSEDKLPVKRHGRKLTVLLAAVVALLAMTVTAMAVSEDFRERIFAFFHIEQKQIIPENTINTEVNAENMFAEPGIVIGDVIQGRYIHTPVSTLAEEGVFLVCTDDAHTKQGSYYDAYYENQGEFIKLDEHTFAQDYVLHGTTFRVEFDWAEHNGKTIVTWVDENTNTRIPGNAGDPSALLIQFVFASTNDSGDYIESYYPVLLNLRTGELTDVLAGTGAERLEWIGNSAISEDLTKMLLCSITKDGYSLHYVDLTSNKMHSLEELSGEKVESCSLIGNKLACWSLTDGYYKAWSIDLTTLQRTELFAPVFNAAATPEADAGIMFMMGFDNWVHEGNMYAGSIFALEVDEAQNVFVIDLATGQKVPIAGCIWTPDTQKIPSPDGTKLLLAEAPDGQEYKYVGVLDFDNLTFTEFSRENGQNEYLAYWFDENTVVICGELSPESMCSDYYLYQIIP